MFKTLKSCLLLLVLGIAYLFFWPVPVEPKTWEPSVNPGYTGVYAVNNRLADFQLLTMGAMSGPEAAVLNSAGDIIATSDEGWLVRFKGGQQNAEKWVEVGGRPLGLDIDVAGNIWVANAYTGLQRVTPEGKVSLILNSIDGERIGYADDVAIANGKIYFSDATTRFYPPDWGGTFAASVLDIIEHGKTGRVIEYDPQTKQAKLVLDDLSFANGVAADPNGQFILVNETGEYRVWKLWLDGPNAGQKQIILSGLPGFPDNINSGNDGVFWLGLVGSRSDGVDSLSDKVFWRKVLIRLPKFMQPDAGKYAMVLGIDQHGNVVENLQNRSGDLFTTTGLIETDDHIFITSLTAPFLAKISKKSAGL